MMMISGIWDLISLVKIRLIHCLFEGIHLEEEEEAPECASPLFFTQPPEPRTSNLSNNSNKNENFAGSNQNTSNNGKFVKNGFDAKNEVKGSGHKSMLMEASFYSELQADIHRI